MGLEHFGLVIEKHAYERYCQRVKPICREELYGHVSEQLMQTCRRKRGYIQIGGVWWRYSVQRGTLILHTCYGQTHIDLPAAIEWAKRKHDRIDLGVGAHAEMRES